ncbi:MULTISPECIES: zinc-finger domain-containing protein [Parageobacillus]|uniref:Zinc-finger domain-containing protein n=1 Tax=Parageobacillus toebii TaxID=153151 RepID=A0A150MJ88_9BACL|nr:MULTISPECIES: zinc-finger domain-containing protein [Parageobacillus]KYD24587.1 hypothetical protein B4110_0595 [Parageobacillus toebii]GCD83699.1 hypothetical protein PTHTG4_27630 [Parageobacillus thermoglucosidasius]
MNKHEKKRIRLQISDLLDRYCRVCRERMQYRDSVCLTVCPVSQEMQRLAAMLEDPPNDSKPAETPQNATPRRKGKWTAEEVFYLWHHRRVLTIDQLADRLNREPDAVFEKLRQLVRKGGISHVS